MEKDALNTFIIQINLSDGIPNQTMTPNGYSCDIHYWDMAISSDETKAFVSLVKKSTTIGAICKWNVGTLDPMDWIELGSLYVPLHFSRIVDNKVFLEANEISINGDLYFVYLDLDTDDMLWNK